MSVDRPELHKPDHDAWDQGGYCNELVLDHDGESATICGYRTPRAPYTPSLDTARNNYASSRNMADIGVDPLAAFDEFDRMIAKVRAEAWNQAYDEWALSPAGDYPDRENPYESEAS